MDDPLTSVNGPTIGDGNALFYYLKDVPDNFRQICEKLHNMTCNYKDFIVSTDTYKATSVKALEYEKKGILEKLTVKGSNTKKTHDWKGLLCNKDNK